MRKALTYPILGLILFLFCWIHLPSTLVDRLRFFAIAPFGGQSDVRIADDLQQENRNLRSQIDLAYEWILSSFQLKELQPFLGKTFASVSASVIYRDPSFWSSSLWVDVGEKHHIAKDSPVIAGGALVGVVEYVGKRQSRIRLITDSGLSPAVQVHRGKQQNRELARRVDSLFKLIQKREDLFSSPEEKQQFIAQLMKLCENHWEDGYLARGEVHGSSSPLWRSRSPMLRGIGFHFDYPDGSHAKDIPILKEGDLLVTSGLDGVFPPGLPVGIVFKVDPAHEGSFAYEIDVRPVVDHLNDLQTVTILSHQMYKDTAPF